MTYMELVILGNFTINIEDVGIEWVKLSWENGGDVTIQYSNDTSNWYNITSIDQTLKTGYQINLQSDNTYYFRGKNDTSEFAIITQKAKDTAEIEDYYLYITIFICFISLVGLYYYLEDSVFGMIGGMLIGLTALSIFNIGFPNLANEFLKNSLVTILWGIGGYYVVMPGIKIVQEGYI